MLSSKGLAAERQGDRFGEFVEEGVYEGRPYYRQRDTLGKSHILYSEGDKWMVSSTLGGSSRGLFNNQNTSLPMTTGWLFWSGEKVNSNDASITLEFTALSPCQLVRVAGKGEVVEKQGSSLGDYRLSSVILLNILFLIPSS